MEIALVVGWMIFLIGAFWWTNVLIDSLARKDNKLAPFFTFSSGLMIVGFLMIGDHTTIPPGSYWRLKVFGGMAAAAIALRILSAHQRRTAKASAPVRPSPQPSRTVSPPPPPQIATPAAQTAPSVQPEADAARVAPLNKWGHRVLADHLSVEIGLAYDDAEHHHTERVVIVHKIEGEIAPDGRPIPTYLHGFCTVRRQNRTFKAESIAHAYDPKTGEIVNPMNYLLGPNFRMKPPR